MKLYYDMHGIVRVASNKKIVTNLYQCIDVDIGHLEENPVGKRIVFRGLHSKPGMRLAVVCNWGDACGIATYSRYLVDAIRPLVGDIKIFAEVGGGQSLEQEENVERCWQRGRSMAEAMKRVVAWHPSVVLIQHEFGIFPKATFLLQMLNMLDAASLPYVVTLHSVYEHLDKVICSSAMKNIVVHSTTGENCLRKLGHTSNIRTIPHGCVQYDDVAENWNITQTPYAIVQFGFGFNYKGVDLALEAISLLKKRLPEKYSEATPIHYCYLCSESTHLKNINNDYYRMLLKKIEVMGLTDNAVIIRGFQTEAILNQYLRTYKLAVFPYVQDPHNVVYGASGAVRIAMANHIPTLVSTSHMFDDVDGVLPRAKDAEALSLLIDRVFGDHLYRQKIISQADEYVRANSWPITAQRYHDFFSGLVDGDPECSIIRV